VTQSSDVEYQRFIGPLLLPSSENNARPESSSPWKSQAPQHVTKCYRGPSDFWPILWAW